MVARLWWFAVGIWLAWPLHYLRKEFKINLFSSSKWQLNSQKKTINQFWGTILICWLLRPPGLAQQLLQLVSLPNGPKLPDQKAGPLCLQQKPLKIIQIQNIEILAFLSELEASKVFLVLWPNEPVAVAVKVDRVVPSLGVLDMEDPNRYRYILILAIFVDNCIDYWYVL